MGIQAGTTLKVEFSKETFKLLELVLRDSAADLFFEDAERNEQVRRDVIIIKFDIEKSMAYNYNNYINGKIEIEFTAPAIAKLDCWLQNYEMFYPDFLTSEETRRNAVNKIYAELHKAGYR